MLSIGELAHRTGVSRRTLRHWDDLGVLRPAEVDPGTRYRRYAPSQAARVHAVAALRALGFGLAEVRDLRGSDLTMTRLLQVLGEREAALTDEVAAASARLAEVQRRLRSIERGELMTTSTLELTPLPQLRLVRLSAHVTDESEIGAVVRALVRDLREHLHRSGHDDDPDLVLIYDGTQIDGPIEVSVGVEQDGSMESIRGLDASEIAAVSRGASIRYDSDGDGVGDAWLTLDAALEPYGLETAGVHRQLMPSDGPVLLQAPVQANGERATRGQR